MAPHSDKMKLMRIVVREDFTKSRCDALLADFKLALQTLDSLDEKKLKEQKEYVSSSFPISFPLPLSDGNGTKLTRYRHAFSLRRRSTLVNPVTKKGAADLFEDDHSLQAQHDKTHAVC
jgi:glutamate decarboxylase